MRRNRYPDAAWLFRPSPVPPAAHGRVAAALLPEKAAPGLVGRLFLFLKQAATRRAFLSGTENPARKIYSTTPWQNGSRVVEYKGIQYDVKMGPGQNLWVWTVHTPRPKHGSVNGSRDRAIVAAQGVITRWCYQHPADCDGASTLVASAP